MLGPKSKSRNLTKLTKILNCTKSSYIMLYTKMSRYSHYTHFLQEESTHVGLRILTKFGVEVSRHFWAQYFLYIQIIYCRNVLKAFLLLISSFTTTLSHFCRLFITSQYYTNFYQNCFIKISFITYFTSSGMH